MDFLVPKSSVWNYNMAYTKKQICGAVKANGQPCQNPINWKAKKCRAGHTPSNSVNAAVQVPVGVATMSYPEFDIEEILAEPGFDADDLYAGALEEEEEEDQVVPEPAVHALTFQTLSANVASCVIGRMERFAAMKGALEESWADGPAVCADMMQFDSRVSLTDGKVMEAHDVVLGWVAETDQLSDEQKEFIRTRTKQLAEEFANVAAAHNTSIQVMGYGQGALGDSATTALAKLRNGLKSEQDYLTMRDGYLRSYRDELHRFCAPLGVRVGREEWFKPVNAAIASAYSGQTFLTQTLQQMGG